MTDSKQERKIVFTITEEYIAHYLAACETAGVTGVGSLISLTLAKGCEVAVYPGGLRCSVYCDAPQKHYREILWYDSMPVCYELSDGVLLRVSKNVVLYLPITADEHSNKSLHWMRKQLRAATVECITYGVLLGAGIGRLSHMKDWVRTRSKQRRFSSITLMFIMLWILPFAMGLGFIYGAWYGGSVPYAEAVPYTGVFQSYYTTGGKNAKSYLDLEGMPPLVISVPRDHEVLENLPQNAEVQVMLHPRTDEVLEVIVGDDVLASFDEAYTHLNRTSAFVALVGCLSVGLGVFIFRATFVGGSTKENSKKRSWYDVEIELQETNRKRKKMASKQRKKK